MKDETCDETGHTKEAQFQLLQFVVKCNYQMSLSSLIAAASDDININISFGCKFILHS